ncbi:hypothetical protein HDV06_006223 [Boothiomyces sp. JEL0866]|nr:hypothetical protein HDV06_006223 [Boothiomyces sp. JEL0866]
MEVEIAPGIYLTKRTSELNKMQKAQQEQKQFLESDPKAHYEYLSAQINITERAINQLEYSNKEMFEHDPNDPVFIEAIAENIIVIDRQRVHLQEMEKKKNELAASLGICLKEELENKEFVIEGDANEVFL